MTFDSTGRLYRITDRSGNHIQVTWKASPNQWQIDKITDTTGRDFSFTYHGTGRLEKITDFDSREIQFDYDSNDDLQTITLQEDESGGDTPDWDFTYSSGQGTASLNHNLLTIVNPESQTVVSNTYETTAGARQDHVKEQDYGDQETYKIYYDDTNSKTKMTNGSLHRREYFWDSSYTNVPEKLREYTGEWVLDTSIGVWAVQATKYRPGDPDYFETQWTWNADRQVTKMKEQRDASTWNSVKYTYDSNGNLTELRRKEDDSQADDDDDDLITDYTYNTTAYNGVTYNQVITVTDPEESVTTHYYDYDEYEDTTDYNGDGTTTALADIKGNRMKISYPNISNPSSVTGINETFDQETTGQTATKVVEVQEDSGSAATTGTYTFTYDNHYNLKKITKPENNDTKEIKVDERELKFKEIGFGGLLCVDPPYVRIDYDRNGTVDQIKDAEDNYTLFEYNGFKQKTKTKDDLDNYTTYTYDKNGNVTEIKRYDEEGATDTLMSKTKRYYNTHNQMWKEERAKTLSPSETYITYTYTRDENGNITRIDGPNDTDTVFTFDALDRKLTETDDAGNIVEYEYEDCGCGLITEETHKELDGETTLTYVIEYDYDELGRKTDVTVNDKDSAGTQVTTFQYDSMGNVVEVTDAENNVKEFLYGGVNRKLLTLTEDYSGANERETEYSFDKNGNLTDIEDDNANVTHYTYDTNDRLEYVYYDYYISGGENFDSQVKYEYDDNDNITKIRNQYTDGGDNDYVEISYTYDDLNQLTTVEIKDDEGGWIANGNEKLTYAYDAARRMTEAKAYDPYTTVISDVDFEYNPLSRVTDEKQTLFGGTQRTYSFEYNDYGALTEITYPNSDDIDITRTAIHTINEIKEGANALVDYTWIGPHRPKQIDYYNGCDVVYDYDGYRRMDDLNNKYSNGTSIIRFQYGFDDVGNREWEKNVGDSTYDVYSYNKAYQLTAADLGCSDSGGSSPSKEIDYIFEDYIGNRDYREVDTGSTTKTYYCTNDVNEYFIARDSASAINCSTERPNRTHDDNGNLTSDPDYDYTYDYANRLIKVMDGRTTIAEYWYDALGRRIKKDDQTLVTHFYYHGAQVYEEYSYDEGETLEARYIYGNEGVDDVKVMMRTESSELDEYYYYHKNSLGTIVAVTDDNGDLAEQYSYDPYGLVTMKDGQGSGISSSAILNPYLFTGRRYDEEIEKYYYRARHYDPDTGRFMQRDPIGHDGGTNLYEYCLSNPKNHIDFTGKWPYRIACPGHSKWFSNIPWTIHCTITENPTVWKRACNQKIKDKLDSIAKNWFVCLECTEPGKEGMKCNLAPRGTVNSYPYPEYALSSGCGVKLKDIPKRPKNKLFNRPCKKDPLSTTTKETWHCYLSF